MPLKQPESFWKPVVEGALENPIKLGADGVRCKDALNLSGKRTGLVVSINIFG